MYLQVRISATSEEEAQLISKSLVEQKLVAGTMYHTGICDYWWENKIEEKEYFNIRAYTKQHLRMKIVQLVERLHSDECPIILFSPVDGSPKTLAWIDSTLQAQGDSNPRPSA